MHDDAVLHSSRTASAGGEQEVDPRASADAAHVEALELMSGLLLGVGEGSPPDAFFSSLCEAICDLTAMRRAVLFRYDSDHRRVRAVGAHGIGLERFADLFVTIDSVPVARQALSKDRVMEVLGTADFDVPSSLREPFEDALIVCTPMAAARRYVGVVLSERDAAAPPMGNDERNLLWTLGKAIAMASVAREVTASDERSRQLQQRIDLAREIHDGVVQRLFGVSLALSQPQQLDLETQRRCADEVQTALGDLRTALQRPLGHSSRPTAVTFAEELARVRGMHPDIEIVLAAGSTEKVPANLEALAQSVLVEAVRNANKHAHPDLVDVSLRNDGRTLVLEVRNDCSERQAGGRSGIGLRLAALEALQHGGVVEYGEPEPGIWQVRLVVPTGQGGGAHDSSSARARSGGEHDGGGGAGEGQRPLRVLVVDDHDVVHWGFRLMLGQLSWVQRCRGARTPSEALAICREFEPHVALVDLFLGGESGPELCERLRALAPAPRVILMSGAGGISPSAARAAGAAGFISKDWPAGEIARLVRTVGDGGEVFRASGGSAALPKLTEREGEILTLISDGSTNREIAQQLHLSPHTVKEHTSTLYRKLGARNRADAVQRAQRLGLPPKRA